jgi:hypothetical protein
MTSPCGIRPEDVEVAMIKGEQEWMKQDKVMITISDNSRLIQE